MKHRLECFGLSPYGTHLAFVVHMGPALGKTAGPLVHAIMGHFEKLGHPLWLGVSFYVWTHPPAQHTHTRASQALP